MKTRITPHSEIHRCEHEVWQQLGGECVIHNQQAGLYYGLDDVGARVWELLQTPATVEAIRDLIMAELDVDPVCGERDLMVLLAEMAEAGLIQVVEGHA